MTSTTIRFASLAAAALFVTACASAPHSDKPLPAPRDGTELVTRMHDAYAGKWYKTLTFVQKTTRRKPDGTDTVSVWYESLLSPDRLRIDIGSPSEGNGVIYTADSLYVVRKGALVRTIADGNVFLPFVAGIYTQPVERSLAQIAPYKFDLSRVRLDMWDGRPVYVVGARDAQDLDSPQFWIDAERLIALRMLVPLVPNGKAKAQDIRLEKYVETGGGWLATTVRMLDAGELLQGEDYSDWKTGVALSPEFFVAEKWGAVPHWAK
jgi:outer membrane lipoprotein-sorting protein